jgi:hypothetical protein
MEVCRCSFVWFAIILTMLTCSKLFNYVTVVNPTIGFFWTRLLSTVICFLICTITLVQILMLLSKCRTFFLAESWSSCSYSFLLSAVKTTAMIKFIQMTCLCSPSLSNVVLCNFQLLFIEYFRFSVLDLRRPQMQSNLRLRHNFVKLIRRYMLILLELPIYYLHLLVIYLLFSFTHIVLDGQS